MSSSNQTGRGSILNRIADRIDLGIDLITLGQYGLERVPEPAGDRRPRSPQDRRRGSCAAAAAGTWSWPVACGDAATR